MKSAESPATSAMSRVLLSALLVSAVVLGTAGCLELEPLDPDKPLPSLPLRGSIVPPPACATGGIEYGDEDLVMHVIDVGQGDAIFLQLPDDGIDGNGMAEGLNVLIDAGPTGFFDTTDGGKFVVEYLRSLNIGRIDYAVVSHAHADHYGGMTDVFDEFDVINVIDPGYTPDTSSYTTYLNAAEAEVARNGGEFYRPVQSSLVAQLGDELDWGSDLQVTLIHARNTADLGFFENAKVNNTSVVLRLEFAGKSILFMGDCEEDCEEQILSEGFDVSANILKVGHHGSDTSSTTSFLGAVYGPVPVEDRWAVISSGRISFSGVQLPNESTVASLVDAVGTQHYFSTEFGDSSKTEEEAPGDDDILFVITTEGEIAGCFL